MPPKLVFRLVPIVFGGDDGDRNAGSDKALLDGRRPRLVLEERTDFGHVERPLWVCSLPELYASPQMKGSKPNRSIFTER
jgi:hypothetical protein